MERKAVSVWVGTAESDAALEDYLAFRYDEDGDRVASPFSAAFALGWFDEDLREAAVVTPSGSLRALLSGFSYAASFEEALIAQHGETLGAPANAVVLLYDFTYTGEIARGDGAAVALQFLGSFAYKAD